MQVREALIALVNADYVAAYPLIPIVYDNKSFDRNNAPVQWVEYEVKFAGADQVGMSVDPKTRTHGFLYVTVWTKEGEGWRTTGDLLGWFSDKLKYRSTNGVNLQAAELVSDKPPAGWFCEQIKLYFYTGPA